MATIELKGRTVVYETGNGLEINFNQFDEKQKDINILEDDWWGSRVSLPVLIWTKFKTKPVKITIELAE